jgi:multiple sugar transport system ATP-binding protein
LHKRLGVTSIYVTHDQVEAMTLADRIVVMNDGRIEQIGTPMELFNNPANTFVAGFLGSPPMNQVKGVLTAMGAKIGDTEIKIDGVTAADIGRAVTVGIRPEHVALKAGQGTSPLPIDLDLVEPLGSEALLHARFGDIEMVFKAETHGDIGHLSGVTDIHVDTSLVMLFDGETGQALNLGG